MRRTWKKLGAAVAASAVILSGIYAGFSKLPAHAAYYAAAAGRSQYYDIGLQMVESGFDYF